MMCCRYVDDIFTMHMWCIDDDSDEGGEVMMKVVVIRMTRTFMMSAT